ncbi:hypothetical protein RHS01_03009 [Rhizoctonia solani]|uniref:DNA damage-binding protein CMR1 n=1 Tax=Rhizoctonia solani TaxID=456999 RepID=A0A8H7II60_9AGAM|nr:hypothetical protein RHS01_03009 [Rhizoctonia solani]
MNELTEYERARAANIAANQSLLAQIGIKDVQQEISASAPAPKAKTKKEKPVQPQKRKAETPPTIRPEGSREGSAPVGLLSLRTKQTLRDGEEFEEAKLQKEAEEEASDLDFEVLAEDFEEEETKTWGVLQTALVQKKLKQQVGSWAPEVSDEKKMAQEKDNLVTELKKLTLTKDVIFFGDKAGTIGIWDARAKLDDHEGDADEKISAEDGNIGAYSLIGPKLQKQHIEYSRQSSSLLPPMMERYEPQTLFQEPQRSSHILRIICLQAWMWFKMVMSSGCPILVWNSAPGCTGAISIPEMAVDREGEDRLRLRQPYCATSLADSFEQPNYAYVGCEVSEKGGIHSGEIRGRG